MMETVLSGSNRDVMRSIHDHLFNTSSNLQSSDVMLLGFMVLQVRNIYIYINIEVFLFSKPLSDCVKAIGSL